MDQLQKYVNEALGIELKYSALPNNMLSNLPVYLRNNKLKTGEMFERKIIFIAGNNEVNSTAGQYKRQADIIENSFGKPVVFVFENVEAYNRKRLIQKNVAFIIPGKQMYLPFMFIDLKEIKQVYRKKVEKFTPAAQCLLFYYLLGNNLNGINFKTLAEKLNYGGMTVTRAANALAESGICSLAGTKEKFLVFEKKKMQLWNEAKPYLINPVHKTVFTNPLKNSQLNFITGISALSYYTNIADDGKMSYAVSKKAFESLNKGKIICLTGNTEEDMMLQIWKYNPGILTNNRYVDPLSLYLTFKDSKDERIENELKRLLDNPW